MMENPKAEGRNPKEVRGPKSEAMRLAVAASSVRCTRFSVSAKFQDDTDDNGHFRVSDFGLLSAFDIRISDLSCCPALHLHGCHPFPMLGRATHETGDQAQPSSSPVKIRKAVITAAGRRPAEPAVANAGGPRRPVQIGPHHPAGGSLASRHRGNRPGDLPRAIKARLPPPPARTPIAFNSSSNPQPLGYGHAVLCAPSFTGDESVPAVGGRPPLRQQKQKFLRPAIAGDRLRRSLRGFGGAGHARKQAALLRRGRRAAAAGPRRSVSGGPRAGKTHADRGRTKTHRARFARRPLPLLLRHARTDAGRHGYSATNW